MGGAQAWNYRSSPPPNSPARSRVQVEPLAMAIAESREALCATTGSPKQELWALGLWEAPGKQRSRKLNMLLAVMEK